MRNGLNRESDKDLESGMGLQGHTKMWGGSQDGGTQVFQSQDKHLVLTLVEMLILPFIFALFYASSHIFEPSFN